MIEGAKYALLGLCLLFSVSSASTFFFLQGLRMPIGGRSGQRVLFGLFSRDRGGERVKRKVGFVLVGYQRGDLARGEDCRYGIWVVRWPCSGSRWLGLSDGEEGLSILVAWI